MDDKIMERIREDIKDKGNIKRVLSFSEIPIDYTGKILMEVQNNGQLIWNTDVGRGIKSLLKRIIRKGMVFFIVPIVEQQNICNHYLFRTIKKLNEQMADQRKDIENLKLQMGERK